MRLSLRQLNYLIAVIDAGSLTRAAERLNVTPTSLSLQMKHLEELVGSSLLVRHSRGVSATETGMILYTHAEEILRRVAALEDLIFSGGIANSLSLRIGAVPAVTRMLGVEAVAGAAQHLKGTTLLLSEGWSYEMQQKLNARTLDFVIAYDLHPYDDIEVVTFFEDEFLFICRPDRHPPETSLDLAEILASDLVFYGRNSVSWRAVRDTAAARNLPFSGHREVQSIDVWRGMLCRGMGTTVGPFAAVRDEVLRGDLAVHRLRGAPVRCRISMAARREMLTIGRRTGFVDLITRLMETVRPAFSSGGNLVEN